jgi:hypothetical protein
MTLHCTISSKHGGHMAMWHGRLYDDDAWPLRGLRNLCTNSLGDGVLILDVYAIPTALHAADPDRHVTWVMHDATCAPS